MTIKTFAIEAQSTSRDKKTLDSAVEDTVNKFISESGLKVSSIDVDVEYSVGLFGKAFVTVLYETKEKK